jgi:hypothetical protein
MSDGIQLLQTIFYGKKSSGELRRNSLNEEKLGTKLKIGLFEMATV